MSAELLLAIPPTIDLCRKYIKEGRNLCSALKHADVQIPERFVRLDNNWLKFLSQLGFFQRMQYAMEDEHREVYCQTLHILQNKLDIVVSLLRGLAKVEPGSENDMTLKVSRLRFASKKATLDDAIEDLEKWQGLADQSWFLLLRIATPQVDQILTDDSGTSGDSTRAAVPATIAIRAGLQRVDDLPQTTSAGEHLTLPSSVLHAIAIHAIPLCDSIAIATRTHSNGTASRYILNHIQCSPGAKPQILKRNVRDLVRKLQPDEPDTFGLLKCKRFVTESVQSGPSEHLKITLVLREPPTAHNPRSLRDSLLNASTCMSTTRRLAIARDLARSVGYVHTFGFVHKNVRPESVLIFDRADSQSVSAFLVGFEDFHSDDGWTQRQGDDAPDKNLYRHTSRQGFSPRDDYEMRHDIYSLGVCLLEIGLWSSFVEYDRTTGARSLAPLVTASPEGAEGTLSSPMREHTINCFIALARSHLPGNMGDRYAEIVETCLMCLDPGNVDFGDKRAFEDADGILVGARYIDKVLLRLGRLNI